MEFRPRYSQPFTLIEAVALDVSTIAEEIARLDDSLRRLCETQDILRDHINSEQNVDPEITKALEENKGVIGSQQERIMILRLALTEKGVIDQSHYMDTPAVQPSAPHVPQEESTNEDEGIHL